MPTPAIIWKGTTALVTQPGSGKVTLADRTTTVDIYKGPRATCEAGLLRRGTYGTGARLGWVVTNSTTDPERKGVCTLTISWELGGAYANPAFLPLDEFEIQPVELNPKVERNKVFLGPAYPGNPNDTISLLTLSYCYSAVHGATAGARNTAIQNINNLSNASQKAWGLQLLFYLNKGIETYYQAGLKYVWTWYSFTLPALTAGGIIQAPLGPMYGSFSAGMSFLRLCDSVGSAGVNGSVFKITSTWLGAGGGYWEPTLYS